MNNSAPVVLVTGASTGLGLAVSRLLSQNDFRLILTARSSALPRLEQAGFADNDRLWLRPMDVRSDAERRRVVDEAGERWGGIDVLLNNAGMAYRSVVEHINEEVIRDSMEVNFLAPLYLIRLVLPRMREKHAGRIINVSSVGGMMAMPTMAFYSASKFALEGATEALWYEVRPWNIKVTLVQPGFIHSDSFQNTRYTVESQAACLNAEHPYHPHYAHMAKFIAKFMEGALSTPDDVADKILSIIRRPDPPLRVPATPDAHVFSWIRRWLPRRLYHQALYWCLPHVRSWRGR